MDGFFGFLVIIIGLLGGALIFNVLNMYSLNKYKPNKWILLGAAIVGFLLSIFLLPSNMIFGVKLGIGLFFASFFGLWFMDRKGYRDKKEKQIVIKPKAKPNRVKNNNKEIK